jgi:hypothetical protein
MRAAFMELVHATTLCHARTLNKNEAQLQMHAYWATWKRDLRVFVAACKRCAEYHVGNPPRQGALRPTGGRLGAPAQMISVDLVGPLPNSCGYKYCLTAEDCFTKFIMLRPLRDKTALHVAQALMQIFLQHGFYRVVKSDNGGEFICALQAELDKLMQSVRLTTLPYTPKQNSIERSHRTLHSMISKTIDNHAQWSSVLSYIAFVYNSTVHKSTGFTPHLLHYGRELANSVNLLLANPTTEYETYGEFASEVIERMTFAHQLARETLQGTAMQAKRYYDAMVRPQVFHPGDAVLVYYPRRRQRHFPKWQRLFSMEAKVVSRVNDITYVVQIARSRQRKIVHVDKLKLLERAEGAGADVSSPAVAGANSP